MAMATGRCPSLVDLVLAQPAFAAIVQSPPYRPRPTCLAHCKVDGLALDDHPRCRRCRILVGPQHYREDLIDGLCEACYLDVHRRRLK